MKLKKSLVAALLAVVICTVGCSPITMINGNHTEEIVVLRLATDITKESAGYRQLEDFQKRLSSQSGDRIRVKLYPSGAWSEDDSLIDYLAVDALEMVCVSNDRAAVEVPAYEIFNLPYLFSSHQQVSSYLTGALGQEALALVEPLGYYAVGFVGNNYQYFLQGRGSSVVTGWSGLTMAVQQKPLWIQALAAIGVTAVEAQGDAVYYDARCVSEAEAKKLMTQQIVNEGTYINDPDMFYNVEMVLCDLQWWEMLPEADRELISKCFDEALEQNMQTLETTTIGNIFNQGGVTVDFVTAEQKQALYQATANVRSQYLYSGVNPLASQWVTVSTAADEASQMTGQQ